MSTKVHEDSSKSILGFWIYLMTDCLLFASLFATFAVLHNNTAGGESGAQLFSLPYIFVETMVLLISSFTCGLAILASRRGDKETALPWLGVTALLGLVFLTMELSEFTKLVHDGSGWANSGFLSSYFTLVGTHGLHITIGLIWLMVLFVQLARKGLAGSMYKRLFLFSLFWHFLDIVWILIFSIVYLMGVS